MVGIENQAQIPEGLCKYDDALPYDNEDKLVWHPYNMSSDEIEDYLIKATGQKRTGSPIRDDEKALFFLFQCGYNTDEALRRLQLSTPSFMFGPPECSLHLPLLSEGECNLFEEGLSEFGKNFRLIQKCKVRTRSIGELVNFYYFWKKTERYDLFPDKAKLIYKGKKYTDERMRSRKFPLNPDVIDHMERFLGYR